MEKIKAFDLPELEKVKLKYSTILYEIRKRVFRIVYVFFAFTILGFIFYEKILKFLINILSLDGINIVFTSPFQLINLSISCGVAIGIVAVFPALIVQILSFLKPALKIKEFKIVTKFLPYSLFLFAVGFFFGLVIMKWQINIFSSRALYLGIESVLDISKLFSTILLTAALLGLSFQFPIVLLILMRLNIISSRVLTSKRGWIYLGSFVFAMFLPADSIVADIFLSLPLILLFESTLVFNKLFKH